MRLLICTQAIDSNDPILGFFCRWVEEFAKHCEQVTVICLREGEHQLPANVRVYSLGKERSAVSKLRYALRFCRLLWKVRHEYDAVFVHMNPEYVMLGAHAWHKRGRKVALWYMHKNVDFKLRRAAKSADVIFTASPESFRLATAKLQIVGHGIDVERFRCPAKPAYDVDVLRLVTVGRLSPAKNIEALLSALKIFSVREIPWTFDIIGAPVTSADETYEMRLREVVSGGVLSGRVRFLGPKTQEEVAGMLCQYEAFLHASTGTGSLDKTALEAMSCAIPVISISEAFRDLLTPHGLFAETPEMIPDMLGALSGLVGRPEWIKLTEALRADVVARHSLQSLIPRILAILAKKS